MTTNLFLPVQQQLEKEVAELSFSISIEDGQLGVYSSHITDLVVRVSTLIESLSKELYFREQLRENPSLDASEIDRDIPFDYEALKVLNQKWKLDKKVAIVSHPNCHQTERELFPFVKSTKRTGKSTMTYLWNNAYQNLKHDRIGNFQEGNLSNLFSAMSALFILNAYYAENLFDLGLDARSTGFDRSLGSSLFSCEVASFVNYNGNHQPYKPENHGSSIYVTNWTDEHRNKWAKWIKKTEQLTNEAFLNHPKAQQAFIGVDIGNTSREKLLAITAKVRKNLNIEELKEIHRQGMVAKGDQPPKAEYEAKLNKHDIDFA